MAVQPLQTEEQLQVWAQVLLSVRDKLGSHQAFETWFKPIVPRAISPQYVELEVPNAFFVDWIHEHHLSTLRQCLADTLGGSPEIRFSALEPAPSAPVIPPEPHSGGAAPAPARPGRVWLDSQLNPRLTFESFVVGSSNRFTHAACRGVAANPGHAYNPLFIFGGSGLGKTHLLHAVGHAVKQARPEARVYYVPAERFTNEMIYSIQHAQTLAFRNKYRSVDVLLIDDIQFLAGKESTQEEFFYTFNALRDAHKQIVVTADKPPKDIRMLEERLTSRFNQGLVTDIKQPDIETRIAILRNRCEQEGDGLRLPEDVLLLIADRIRTNIRDLEGCLVRLMAVASLTHQEITLDLADEVLQNYVNPEPDQLTPERILAAVAERFGVRSEAMCGQRRTRTVALPRQVAMYLTRQLTELSLVEIGRMFGDRDHTTVMYACDKIAALIASDSDFADRINGLISTLASG
ncbi:MAG: chromosomal replication initiator protein DnaA [Candidatus Eisenbacteria bacterium]|nr:chromosomal replication initiator protein DnaA [Candidatus Eisenbacteria bacterium]